MSKAATPVKQGERISVRWEGDGKFYPGVVSFVKPEGGVVGIYYTQGSFEWIELSKVTWKRL